MEISSGPFHTLQIYYNFVLPYYKINWEWDNKSFPVIECIDESRNKYVFLFLNPEAKFNNNRFETYEYDPNNEYSKILALVFAFINKQEYYNLLILNNETPPIWPGDINLWYQQN